MPVFFFINLLAVVGAFRLACRMFHFQSRPDSLIAVFLFYLTQIVLSELVLGILGILSLGNVILLNAAFFLVIYSVTRNKKSSFGPLLLKQELNKFTKNRVALLLFSAIAGFALVKVVINLVNAPFGWDSLNYHFTFPVEWMKHGNLHTPITVFCDPGPTYYPLNASLFFLWLIFPLKNVFLADLGQVPFFVLSLLAVFAIARKIGLNRMSSFYAAALFMLVPNFFKQLEIAYVDVMVGGLFLSCVNFLFLLDREFSFKNTLLYSISLGMLLGVKTVAFPYSLLLLFPFLYLFLENFIINPKRSSIWLAFSFSVIIIIGGFSYIRNLIETGNPLYPLDFKLFGFSIFKGVVDKVTYSAHFSLKDYRLSKLLFHEGLGAQSLFFIFPGALLALPAAFFIRRRKGLSFIFAYFLLLPLLLFLVFRYVIPLGNVRYLYALLGAGLIAGFYLANLLQISKRAVSILVVISLFASIAEISRSQELIISLVLSCLLFFSLPLLVKLWNNRAVLTERFSLICLIIAALSLFLLERNYAEHEFASYVKMTEYSGFWPDAAAAWQWLNENTEGNNVAYAGRPVPFPLYGSDFKNNVYYVSVNRTNPAKLHYYPEGRYRWGCDFLSQHQSFREKGNYRGEADYSVWLSNLKAEDTDYLFVYSLHQTGDLIFPLEDAWAKENPDRFKFVFGNETIHIYRLS